MKLVNKIIIVTIVIALLSGLGTFFFVEIPADWHDSSLAFHAPLGMTSASAALLLGAAILFVLGLSSYKTQVRRAYTAIVISIILTAVGTIQLPVVNGFNLWNTPWVVDGGLALPFVFGGLAAYLGTRSFSRIVGTSTRLTRARIVVPAIVIFMILSIFLPHVTLLPTTSEFAYDLANAVLVWSGLLYFVSGCVIMQVRERIGAHYVHAMAWLSLGLLTSSLIITMLFVDGLFTTATQDAVTNLSDVMIIIAGFIFMKAGYEFYKTTDY